MSSLICRISPLVVLMATLVSCEDRRTSAGGVEDLNSQSERARKDLEELREQIARERLELESLREAKNVVDEELPARVPAAVADPYVRKLTYESSREPLSSGGGVVAEKGTVENPLIRQVRTNRKLSDQDFGGEVVLDADVSTPKRWLSLPGIWSPLPYSSYLQPICFPVQPLPERVSDSRAGSKIHPIPTLVRVRRTADRDRRVEDARKLRRRVERRKEERLAAEAARQEREESEAQRRAEREVIAAAERKKRLAEEAIARVRVKAAEDSRADQQRRQAEEQRQRQRQEAANRAMRERQARQRQEAEKQRQRQEAEKQRQRQRQERERVGKNKRKGR